MDISNSVIPTQPIANSRNSAEASEFMKEVEGASQQNDAVVQDLQNTFDTVAMSFLQPIVMDVIDLLNEEQE
jgi:hypothetical protein